MSLQKIHNISPTGFTTRHDVGLGWNGFGFVYLAWTHYDPDTDEDGDVLVSFWLADATPTSDPP